MVEVRGQVTEELIAELELCAGAYAKKSNAGFYESETIYQNQTQTYDNVYSHDTDLSNNRNAQRSDLSNSLLSPHTRLPAFPALLYMG